MNIHYSQVEKKSQLFSYLLAGFAAFTMLMLALSFSRMAEVRLSVPSISVETAQTEHRVAPVAIAAPMPPAEQPKVNAAPELVGHSSSNLAPQVIPAPRPSVP